jgi:hypothetical protein
MIDCNFCEPLLETDKEGNNSGRVDEEGES